MKAILILFAAALASGAVVGASGAQAPAGVPRVGAFDAASGKVANPSDNGHLARAVERWNAEGSQAGPGRPLVSRSVDLLSAVGNARDTITAFPTSRGAVCYQIRAAGTCGLVNGPAQITFSILWTRDAGGRLYGVGSDDVQRVDVVIAGAEHQAVLRGNGFYVGLPAGSDGSDVQRVISTLKDGSSHVVSVHE